MGDSCFEERSLSCADLRDVSPQDNLLRNDSSPFIHRFQTRRQKYVYDVNTRRIIRVSSIVWDILEDFGCLDEEQIIVKYSPSYSADEIRGAIGQIKLSREKQELFLSFRPQMILPPKEEMIRNHLADRREQLILNVTEDCNFRCSYCIFGGNYLRRRTYSAKAMCWDVAKAAIDEFISHSALSEGRVISFYGGEPLLNLSLIRQCITYVRQSYENLRIQFSLTTNGYLLKGDIAEFLAAEGFLIVISLDGPQEIHDLNRRTKGGLPTWELIISNIREFLVSYPEYRTNGKIRFTAVAPQTTDLRKVQSFFSSCDLFNDSMGLEISEVKQTDDQSQTFLPNDPLILSLKDLHKEFVQKLKSGQFQDEYNHKSGWVLSSVLQKPFVIFHKRGYSLPRQRDKMPYLNTCIPGARRTFVSTNGDYYACERVEESKEGVIGNVREGINMARVMALLEQWIQASQDQCRYCWCMPTCHVGCFATVSEDGKVTQKAKNKVCVDYRRSMDRFLVEYCDILEENPKAFDYMVGMSLM